MIEGADGPAAGIVAIIAAGVCRDVVPVLAGGNAAVMAGLTGA